MPVSPIARPPLEKHLFSAIYDLQRAKGVWGRWAGGILEPGIRRGWVGGISGRERGREGGRTRGTPLLQIQSFCGGCFTLTQKLIFCTTSRGSLVACRISQQSFRYHGSPGIAGSWRLGCLSAFCFLLQCFSKNQLTREKVHINAV